MAWSGYRSMLLLACGAAALDCHADFWPEMHASPRRLEALILANGALVKLCFDADAAGAVHRQPARADCPRDAAQRRRSAIDRAPERSDRAPPLSPAPLSPARVCGAPAARLDGCLGSSARLRRAS